MFISKLDKDNLLEFRKNNYYNNNDITRLRNTICKLEQTIDLLLEYHNLSVMNLVPKTILVKKGGAEK